MVAAVEKKKLSVPILGLKGGTKNYENVRDENRRPLEKSRQDDTNVR